MLETPRALRAMLALGLIASAFLAPAAASEGPLAPVSSTDAAAHCADGPTEGACKAFAPTLLNPPIPRPYS